MARRRDPGPDIAGMRKAESVFREVFGGHVEVIDEGPLDRAPLGDDESRLAMPAVRKPRPAAPAPPATEADGWHPLY